MTGETLSAIIITMCVASSIFVIGAVFGVTWADRTMSKIYQDCMRKHTERIMVIVDESLERARQATIKAALDAVNLDAKLNKSE